MLGHDHRHLALQSPERAGCGGHGKIGERGGVGNRGLEVGQVSKLGGEEGVERASRVEVLSVAVADHTSIGRSDGEGCVGHASLVDDAQLDSGTLHVGSEPSPEIAIDAETLGEEVGPTIGSVIVIRPACRAPAKVVGPADESVGAVDGGAVGSADDVDEVIVVFSLSGVVGELEGEALAVLHLDDVRESGPPS